MSAEMAEVGHGCSKQGKEKRPQRWLRWAVDIDHNERPKPKKSEWSRCPVELKGSCTGSSPSAERFLHGSAEPIREG